MISRLPTLKSWSFNNFNPTTIPRSCQQTRLKITMASETNAAQANAALADSDGPTIFDKIISKQVIWRAWDLWDNRSGGHVALFKYRTGLPLPFSLITVTESFYQQVLTVSLSQPRFLQTSSTRMTTAWRSATSAPRPRCISSSSQSTETGSLA